MMIYYCCQENRRNEVDKHPDLNGIDYLEVWDLDAPPGSPRQRTLMLHLLKPVPGDWTEKNVSIVGGERIRDPKIKWVAPANFLDDMPLSDIEKELLSTPSDADHIFVIRTDTDGDYSDYCLYLQESPAIPRKPPQGFDPRLVEITFSFKVECPSDFDCKDTETCKEDPVAEPDINYLAKDYAGFRQLILDRMSYLLPDWKSRGAADLGVTLAELIAYKGDELSYWQDAVTTEAYLNTARKRTSLRRHALLVDYRISEGRNARSWLHIDVTGGPFELPAIGIQFLTQVEGLQDPDDNRIEPDSQQHRQAKIQHPLVFELLQGAPLFEPHHRMEFYTWGDDKCCLPKGATKATLIGHWSELEIADGDAGQYLLFEEVLGPNTGKPDDADPSHRQVIRLTQVNLTTDPLYNTEITEIQWSNEDALTFPLCISSETNIDPDKPEPVPNVSVARGNMVLVDHGETLSESLGTVPKPWLYYPQDKHTQRCSPSKRQPIPPRFSPPLKKSPLPLSHGAAAPKENDAAAGALTPALEGVEPLVMKLTGDSGLGPLSWELPGDLLGSGGDDLHAVVELDNEGIATLRFGDNVNGARPASGTEFDITYRVGNGPEGNVGADAIAHIVSPDGRIVAVRNPLPAQGGLPPETAAQIRRRAPQAFRTQLRAVTPEDYSNFTAAQEGVQKAATTPRWTGSWHTQFISVDRVGGMPLKSISEETDFEAKLAAGLERYRMAGHDLNFNDPVFVSLQLELQICVSRDYFRSDVEQTLLQIFTSGVRADGKKGLFHPDRFSFGQTVYLSPFVAAARQVHGVSSVQVTRFSRQDDDDPKPLSDGFMSMGKLEVSRLDNNANFPEHGVLKLIMLGGK